MQDKMDVFEEQFLAIKDYICLMQEYQIPVPEIESTSYQMMSSDFNSCKEAMVTAEESKVENVKLFTADLMQQLEEVKSEVSSIRQRAHHDMILDESKLI